MSRESQLPMINLDNLKSLSKNNHAFIREILEVYLTNTPKDVESMEAAVETGDFQMVRYFAHKLKSSSFTIGFNDGFKVFQEIEHDIKNNTAPTDIPEKFGRAKDLCDDCVRAVKIELTNYM